MKRSVLYKAQNTIIDAAVAEALLADERGDPELAEAIRVVASRLAKKFGLEQVQGLPQTFVS